jgi:lysozyme family protein
MQRKKTIHRQGPVHAPLKKRAAIAQPTDLEYIHFFDTCEIHKERLPEIDKTIDGKIIPGKPRYQNISVMVGGAPAISTPALSLGSRPMFSPTSPSTGGLSDLGSGMIRTSPPTFDSRWSALGEPSGSGFSSLNLPSLTQGLPGLGKSFSLPPSPYNTSGRIPWYFIACVHYRECGFSFKKHLHNGDPLTAYTTHVPANRPQVGHPPPFTFEESAVDALKLMHFDKIAGWTLPVILRKLEAYNGFGYTAVHHIPSPYLWGYSNLYSKGLYVSDGKFDDNAVSKQMGTAVILKRMEERGLISIPRS